MMALYLIYLHFPYSIAHTNIARPHMSGIWQQSPMVSTQKALTLYTNVKVSQVHFSISKYHLWKLYTSNKSKVGLIL